MDKRTIDWRNVLKNRLSNAAVSPLAMRLPNGAALVLIQANPTVLIEFAMLRDIPIRPAATGPRNRKRRGLTNCPVQELASQVMAIRHWKGHISCLQLTECPATERRIRPLSKRLK